MKHLPTLVLAAALILFAAAIWWSIHPDPRPAIVRTVIVTIPQTTPVTGCAPINERTDVITGTIQSCSR